MPITLNCSCGKVFRVKDEHHGKKVRCQVCKTVLTAVPAAGQPSQAETVPVPAESAMPAATQNDVERRECPFCAEMIPVKARKCRFCGESLKHHLTDEMREAALAAAMEELEKHLNSGRLQQTDEKMIGRLCTTRTIVLVLLLLCSVGMIGYGAVSGRNGEPWLVFGIIFGIIFSIASLVAFINDYRSYHIQDAADAAKAFTRYFKSIRPRKERAYASLLPSARHCDSAEAVRFENIPSNSARCTISDPKSFLEYWQKNIFKGSTNYVRTSKLKKVEVVAETADGLTAVEATFYLTSYSQWWLLGILAGMPGILIAAIGISVTQKKETRKLQKLLIHRDEKWYIAEAEWEGDLDHCKL